MMEWKGIPYSLDAKEIVESVNSITTVAVDKIPTVVVSTSFSWETVIAAFFSAFVPSLIAWYALRHNYNLASLQQRRVLANEAARELRLSISEFISSVIVVTKLIDFADNYYIQGNTKEGDLHIEMSNKEMPSAELSYNKVLLLLDFNNGKQLALRETIGDVIDTLVDMVSAGPDNKESSLQYKEQVEKTIESVILQTKEVLKEITNIAK